MHAPPHAYAHAYAYPYMQPYPYMAGALEASKDADVSIAVVQAEEGERIYTCAHGCTCMYAYTYTCIDIAAVQAEAGE